MSTPNRACIHRRKSFVNAATSCNLKHLPTGDKEDFAQYGKMISIEEYFLTVILHHRTFSGARWDRRKQKSDLSRSVSISTPGNRDQRLPCREDVRIASVRRRAAIHGQRSGRKNLVGMVCVASRLADRRHDILARNRLPEARPGGSLAISFVPAGIRTPAGSDRHARLSRRLEPFRISLQHSVGSNGVGWSTGRRAPQPP